MSSSLASVLTADDLPAVELQAVLLDGDVYPLGEAFCLIGELEAPRHRARAVLGGRSTRLIAELRTAAWIWGATDHLGRLRFAVSPDARTRLVPGPGHVLREIVHSPGDIAELDGLSVTAPLRTILDLVRAEHPEQDTPGMIGRLAAIGGLTVADCQADLAGRVGIPSRQAVAERLERAFAEATEPGQAVDTR